MIALYEKGERWVAVVEESRRWQEAGMVTAEQTAAVAERYRPELVRVNLFIRILLALFTTVGVVALVALPAVILEVKEVGFSLLCLIFAPLCAWGADRRLIAGRRLYRCGAEEMLLLLTVGYARPGGRHPRSRLGAQRGTSGLAGGARHRPGRSDPADGSLRLRPGGARGGARPRRSPLPSRGHSPLAAAATVPARPLAAARRNGNLVAAGALRPERACPGAYVWSLETVRLAAWAGIYLDVNLYAHRLLWREWLGWTPGESLFTWSDHFCALLTVILPMAALAMGIGRRDRALLWFAVVSAILSILTLKYYIHFGHLAEELTAAGLLLAGLAFGLLRWLRAGSKRCRGAFTAEPLLEPRLYGLDAEALAAIQPLTPAARVPQAEGFQPGGGSFGGGGASSGY